MLYGNLEDLRSERSSHNGKNFLPLPRLFLIFLRYFFIKLSYKKVPESSAPSPLTACQTATSQEILTSLSSKRRAAGVGAATEGTGVPGANNNLNLYFLVESRDHSKRRWNIHYGRIQSRCVCTRGLLFLVSFLLLPTFVFCK